MIIRLVNANDLIGCDGDPQPIRFMHGGVQRCVEGCTEVHRGMCAGAQQCAWMGM